MKSSAFHNLVLSETLTFYQPPGRDSVNVVALLKT